MIHVHDLAGCAPTPLAHYLKALGILRLVAEQADAQARGWWEGERFKLATKLERQELEAFLLERYEPTPMFNPWGARSGFFSGSPEKSARAMLTEIEATTHPRFDAYRMTLSAIRNVINTSFGGRKPEDEDKDRLILALRQSVRGKSSLWMDSVTSVIGAGDSLEVKQPALFGTGGNEGSGSYTSAYMAAIDQCLLRHLWDHALATVLFGENCLPQCDWNQSMGQFMPAGAATPWDLLLAFEGACTVRSAVSSRNTTDSAKWMSSPFYVAPASFGYPSEARLDEYALKNGKELPGRGEQWFPLWLQPMLFAEVAQMFVEGRAITRRGRVKDAWSMVRAIGSLGVRQGIREFVRYGYQQRNNLATHFAVPLGRFRVPEHSSPVLACLDDLDNWLPNLHQQTRAKEAPARLRFAERQLVNALFAVAQHPDERVRWQAVLLALTETEGIMVRGSGFRAGLVPKLQPRWVEGANDGSTEFALALSLALQHGGFHGEKATWWNTVRRHWLPLAPNNPRRFAITGAGAQTRLAIGPEVVMQGRSGTDDAIALVQRRLIEASQRGERRLPLVAAWKAAAHPADLAAWLVGEVDPDRTLALARALMALDGRAWAGNPLPPQSPGAIRHPDDAWLVIRLALLPWPLPDGRRIGADPAIFRRLASGDAASAVELARRRLRAAGVSCAVRVAGVPPETARRWAAALAFPITQKTAMSFLHRLDPTYLQETMK
ncbi:MAG: type I-U CRISPR-associated protein Csx17 [Sulfuritalea sp.]|nr:type I-U CRISPR-associated protein Csx17 [Sulfuritalea sp.]